MIFIHPSYFASITGLQGESSPSIHTHSTHSSGYKVSDWPVRSMREADPGRHPLNQRQSRHILPGRREGHQNPLTATVPAAYTYSLLENP